MELGCPSWLTCSVTLDKSAFLSVCHLQNVQEVPGYRLVLLRHWKAWKAREGLGPGLSNAVVGTEPTVRREGLPPWVLSSQGG